MCEFQHFLPQAQVFVLYLDYMNKEVIYLEPEDDITDILTKLQQAEQKLVALVPPKKATILRSAVNMKLVARVAKECEKVVVIVTTDPAIVKMAMAARIPVAKNLQSRPVVPTEENVRAAEAACEQIIDEEAEDEAENGKKSKKDLKNAKIASKAPNSASEGVAAKSAVTLDLTEEGLENASKKAQDAKAKKKKAQNSENASFIQKYRKLIMIGSAVAVLLVVVLVWALVFAPAVKITVAISSTPSNFSENVRFTTDEAAQNLEEGLFYAEQLTLDDTYKTDSITATGEEDRGEKAKGRVALSYNFSAADCETQACTFNVPEGAILVGHNSQSAERNFVVTDGDSVSWGGTSTPSCVGGEARTVGGVYNCTQTISVTVEAAESGTSYNLPAGSRWDAYNGASLRNPNAMSGGTTEMVRVIGEDDVNKVKETQLAEHIEEGREDLLEDLGSDIVAIESSFKGEVTEVKTTPEQGTEVKDGDKLSAEVKITYSVYAIKKSTIDEYIKLKTALGADQKIYEVGEPYFERFSGIENEAKLKATVETGPTVTEEDILEKVKGKRTGEVKPILKAINGVSDVNIQTSYFWVWSVPTDPNKVSIELVVEDK